MSPAEEMASKKSPRPIPKRAVSVLRAYPWVCNLRKKRRDLNLTQAEVANAVGVSPPAISFIEHGAEPAMSTAWNLAKFFGCTIEDLWTIDQDLNGKGHVVYSDERLTGETIEKGKVIYSGSIYTQRFLQKWVYRAADYTMVCVDTHCDGNKFLMVFDNAKEQNDDRLKWLYRMRWANSISVLGS